MISYFQTKSRKTLLNSRATNTTAKTYKHTATPLSQQENKTRGCKRKTPPKKTKRKNSSSTKTRTEKRKWSTHTSEREMSSKVAEADRYLKTQQQDNDTLTIQHNTTQDQFIIYSFNWLQTARLLTGFHGSASGCALTVLKGF